MDGSESMSGDASFTSTRSAEVLPGAFVSSSDLLAAHTVIGTANSFDAIARLLADQTAALLSCGVFFALIEEQHFHIVSTAGYEVRHLEGLWYERAGSFTEHCIHSATPTITTDLLIDPRFAPLPEDQQHRGAVGVSVLNSGAPVGVLIATSTKLGAFDAQPTVIDVLGILALVASSNWTIVSSKNDLARERLRTNAASTLTGTGVWRWDRINVHWSPEMYEILGLDPVTTTPSLALWESRLHPDDRERGKMSRDRGASPEGVTESLRLRHSDGTWRELVMWSRTQREDDESMVTFGAVADITHQRTAEREVARMSARDGLTGLANRNVLDDLIRRAIVALPPQTQQNDSLDLEPVTALLLLDIDRFKLINDTLGHAVGDALLIEIAHRLTRSLELSAISDCSPTVVRLGGDEFVVLLPWVAGPEAACDVARWLLDDIRQPIDVPGSSAIVCTGSIGVAVSVQHDHEPDRLFREADLAMYRAKDAGRDGVALFDIHMQAQAESRLDTERRLRAAIDDDQLIPFYQPIVSLLDHHVHSMEALVRIKNNDSGWILPDAFIPVAEDTGLIVELDRRMVEHGVRQLSRWRGTSAQGIVIQVNMSARTLSQPGIEEFVLSLITRYKIDPTHLRFELTETSLVPGGSAAQDTLVRLAAAGIRTGVDDFGTGYSALAYLHDMPVTFIKADRTFVSRLDGSAKANAVIRAVIELAHAHGFQVTAEGVETEQQAQLLREMGCDFAQGWLFGRPRPMTDYDFAALPTPQDHEEIGVATTTTLFR
ncbi:MAG: putative bifunctional diguanylate cyclase/phosphodiesterase [Actinomycetota bacterium]